MKYKFTYRVTKYNPKKRNNLGHYTDKSEWTSFSEFIKNSRFYNQNLKLSDYFLTENAYIFIINKVIELTQSTNFKVKKVENNLKIPYRKATNDILMVEYLAKETLREKFWSVIESKNMSINFGHEYYMYINSNIEINEKVINFGGINIYIEKIKESPYS